MHGRGPARPLFEQDDLADACGDDPAWLCERVYDWTNGNGTLAELADWLLGRPLTVLLILIVAWILARLARRYVGRLVSRVVAPDRAAAASRLERLGIERAELLFGDEVDPRRESRARSISAVVGSAATVVIWVIALMMVLGEIGVELGPLVAGAGIAGVALGFGAQSLVKDTLTGLFMLIEDQFGIGDIVDLGEAVGVVEEISLRTTVLRGLDGTVWHVPNGEVQRVGNKSQLWSVAVVDVDVAYDADLDTARQVLLDTANEVCASPEWAEKVLEEPELLGVEALAADGVTLRMIVKTTPGSQWGLQRELRQAFKVSLDGAGIEIPFPQRTVWMRTDAG